MLDKELNLTFDKDGPVLIYRPPFLLHKRVWEEEMHKKSFIVTIGYQDRGPQILSLS
jgi:hypothetical protein